MQYKIQAHDKWQMRTMQQLPAKGALIKENYTGKAEGKTKLFGNKRKGDCSLTKRKTLLSQKTVRTRELHIEFSWAALPAINLQGCHMTERK